ncbi:MAG TPA: hypothetical protein VIZ43_28240 [Trebonia sp.]
MGHVARLRERFGPAVIGGVLRIATELAETGAVEVLSPEFEVEIGEFDGAPSRRVETLAAAFRDAGADVTVSSDITAAMWAKWVFIASVGAITSLMRAPIGDIVAVPGAVRPVGRRRSRGRRRGRRPSGISGPAEGRRSGGDGPRVDGHVLPLA